MNRPSTPVCSVCIANYNGVALLADCLESVLSQEAAGDIEIIVHDDASTDDSISLLRERYPQVELLASQENVGFCVSNNRMVAHAKGEFVLLLNNDAALWPGAITSMIDAARTCDRPSILTLPQYDWESGALVDRGCLLDPFCNPVPNLNPKRCHVAYVIGACLFLPRTLWESVGGLPIWFESIAEDMYLCSVARLRGVPVIALATSGYRHRQGTTFGGNRAERSINTSIRRRCLSERNKTRALIILTPSLLVWPLLCLHLVALMLEGMALSMWRGDAAMLRDVYMPAVLTPFREWVVLRSYRKDIQATRTISVAQWFSTVRWQLRKVVMLTRYGMPKVR